MNTQIFVNLPTADLPRTLAFWKALGFGHNPTFSDDTAACIVISEHIHIMALTYPKFREFTPREICDTEKAVEVLNCLSCESRDVLDHLVEAALANGVVVAVTETQTDEDIDRLVAAYEEAVSC